MKNKKAVKAGKSEKGVRVVRVTAAGILVEQFGLKSVKANAELIEMVREATGSVKFDEKQLAWYKSQYRSGKLKGQDGKTGHPIAQGSFLKPSAEAKAKAKAKVKAKPKAKKAATEEEEPIEG